MWKHLTREASRAGEWDLVEEERLRARNAILVCAAALCPITAILGVSVLLLWDSYRDALPGFMASAAYLYPILGIAGIMLGLYLHKQEQYTLAAALAMAPFLMAIAFFGVWINWGLS